MGQGLDFGEGDGFDGGQDFVEGIEAAEIEFLAGEIRHARTGGFKREHERAFEMILGAGKLFVADRRFLHGAKFLDSEVDHLADGFFRRPSVDGEHAGVGIRSELAENRVGEAFFFANVLEEARRHAAAEKIIENRGGEARLVAEGKRGDTDADMDLLEVALGFEMDGRLGDGSGVIFQRAGGAEIAELALDEIQNLFVRDVASGGDDEMVRREPIMESLDEMIAIEGANGFRSAENGPAERMLGPEAARKNIVKEIFGIVQIHLNFFENDLALFSHVVGIKLGAKNEIGDDVKGDGKMVVEDFGVEADLLFRGEGVEHAADGIHFAGDRFGRAVLGAFEHHVLDEMGEAVFFRDFAARAIANPHADGDGAHVSHGLGDDHKTVAENVLLNVTRFRGSSHI